MKKMVIRGALDHINKTRHVFEEESDLELAKISLASNLKLLETLSSEEPNNAELNLFLAETYAIYTLAFVEDEMDRLADTDFDESNYHKIRAIRLYERAAAYAYTCLADSLGPVDELYKLKDSELTEKFSALNDKQMKALFWFAYAKAASMNLQLDNLNSLSVLPLLRTGMESILKWDESFYFAGPDLFFGMFYGMRPQMMGGDPVKSKEFFEKAVKITGAKVLLVHYFYAKTYCVQTQNRELFKELLEYVLQAPEDLYPKQRLANEIAKKKAQRLLNKEADLFF